MTKKQAKELFEETYSDLIETGDTIAIATEWNDFTDYLCKSGQITLKQYETWTGY